MFHHISLLRFVDETSDEQIQAVIDALNALPDTINQLRHYEVHRDAGLGSDNAQVSVQASFDDEASWRQYATHPDHLNVINATINPILESARRTQYRDPHETSNP